VKSFVIPAAKITILPSDWAEADCGMRCPGVTVKPHDSLSLRNHSQMLHRTRLRNRGGKGEFITVIIVNDHYGFAFDFHFIRRDPASAGKRGEYNFANLFKDALKASATFGLKMESRSS
jgi:hypothetical protein